VALTAPGPARRLARVFEPHRDGRFASLDGYRAVAALGVLVYHVAGTARLTADGSPAAGLVGNLGNFGVAVFFLLSGFLLYRPFVAAHLEDRAGPRWLRFWRHRFLRIFPGYWLALTAFILLVGLNNPSFSTLVTLYTLTQVYRPYFGFAALTVAWTLCIEVSFYVALPFIAAGIRHGLGRGARSPRTRLQAQLLGLAVLWVLGWIYRVTVAAAAVGPDAGPADNQHLWLPNYLDWFALGMVLAVAVAWIDTGGALPGWVRSLAETPWLCLLISGAAYLILGLTRSVEPELVTGTGKETLAQMSLRFFLNGACAFFLLLPAVLGGPRAASISKVMATPVLLFGGTISYGIYLWHKLWLDWLKPDKGRGPEPSGFGAVGDAVRGGLDGVQEALQSLAGTGFWTLLTCVLALTVVTAALSYVGVERPVMRFKDPRSSRSADHGSARR
jgi:peptidoglycan/LPS O-acetylase OafA/YrhL